MSRKRIGGGVGSREKTRKNKEKISKKVLTNQNGYDIISKSPQGKTHGSIAQLGEHLPYKQGVTGSSPVVPTIYLREWLSGRASPCQGERREFESRFPLQGICTVFIFLWRYSQAVRPRSAKPLCPGSNPGGASKKLCI